MDNANRQRGITRRGSQSKAGWRIRCTQGYVSRVGGFGGWGREHMDGEVAVRTDYTVCLQLVRWLILNRDCTRQCYNKPRAN